MLNVINANSVSPTEQNAIQQHQTLTVGLPVRVTNNKPEPPKHHKRKHAEWSTQNYNGVVQRVENDGYVCVAKNNNARVLFSHPASTVYTL